MVKGSGKRVRDYSAERARRNEEARRWGFTSLDQMSKARRRGDFPTRRVLLSDPGAGIRARERMAERARASFDRTQPGRIRKNQPAGPDIRTPANARQHDRESREWSDMHSRQSFTKFNARWSAAKKERYYQTMVKPWGKKRSQEQLDAYWEWKKDFDLEFDENEDPYV